MDKGERKLLTTVSSNALERDYKERPPTVWQMITEDRFFGKLTKNGEMIYPVWRRELPLITCEMTKYLIVLTGAIGTGKTRAAVFAALCALANILCLKNPVEFFKTTGGGRWAIVFFNLTKTLSEAKAYRIFQDHLVASEWFRKHGKVKGKEPEQWLDLPMFECKLGSPEARGFSTVGEDVILAIMDEVDAPNASPKMQEKVIKAYKNTVLRFESRFVHERTRETLGKFFLVASKQERSSFLNTFVASMKDSKSLYVVDVPYWEAKPASSFSNKKFSVAVGDMYIPSKILTSKAEKDEAIRRNQTIVSPPIDFYDRFRQDIVGSLKDIAGVTVSEIRATKFFASEKVISDCYDENKVDPAFKTTIPMSLKKDVAIVNFLDLRQLRMPKSVPRYIHADMAYSGDGDAMGIAMSGVKHFASSTIMLEDGSYEDRVVPVVETDFVLRLKSQPGDQVPIFAMRKLVLDLRSKGYEIRKFTADLALLSADTIQLLSRAGIECDNLSLDKNVLGYSAFRELVNEQRWVCHPNKFLHFELVNLEFDSEKKKVDHPDEVIDIQFLDDGDTQETVLKGSKDLSDAVAGSVYSALQGAATVPVDKQTVRDFMRKVNRPVDSDTNPTRYLLGLDKEKDLRDTYLLQDPKNYYWIWKADRSGTPRIYGPTSEPYVDLPVIRVANPAAFNPRALDQKKPDQSRQRQFIDLLKTVRSS